MLPTIGRMVIYSITEDDAKQINRRRTVPEAIAQRITMNTPNSSAWPLGAQAHIGNYVCAGETFPLMIVRVWPDEFGPGRHGVNGQAFLDGNDVLWVRSADEGPEKGQWQYPDNV